MKWRALLAMAASLILAACEVTPTSQPLESPTASAERAKYASAPLDSPGLGTKWGESELRSSEPPFLSGEF